MIQERLEQVIKNLQALERWVDSRSVAKGILADIETLKDISQSLVTNPGYRLVRVDDENSFLFHNLQQQIYKANLKEHQPDGLVLSRDGQPALRFKRSERRSEDELSSPATRDQGHLYEMIKAKSRDRKIRINITLSHHQLGKTDEQLAGKIGDSVATADKADRDFFNIWTSGVDSNPLIALWAVTAEKPNKESLGESSHESIKETIKPVDKQSPVATLPKTDEEGAKKFNPRPSSPDVSLGNNFIYTFDRKTARELNTALNKISEAFNGNFVSARYKAGDTLSLPVHRNVLDYYSRVVSTLPNAVPANNIGLVLPVVSEFIHAGKVDILVAALESSYLCVAGKGMVRGVLTVLSGLHQRGDAYSDLCTHGL